MEAKPDFTVQDYQRLVQQLAQERGFDNETVSEVFTVLVEEVGELAKAIRKANEIGRASCRERVYSSV